MFRVSVSLLLLGLSCLLGFLYYIRYFKWRNCFNELGRCYDSETGLVYLEQSGIFWGLLTCLTLGAFLFQIWRFKRSAR